MKPSGGALVNGCVGAGVVVMVAAERDVPRRQLRENASLSCSYPLVDALKHNFQLPCQRQARLQYSQVQRYQRTSVLPIAYDPALRSQLTLYAASAPRYHRRD